MARRLYAIHLCPECCSTYTTNKYYCDFCKDKLKRPPLAAKASWRPDWRARTADGKKWAV